MPRRKPRAKVAKTEKPMEAAARSRLPRWPMNIWVMELTANMLRVAMAMGVPMPQRRLDSSHTIRAASPGVRTAGASPSEARSGAAASVSTTTLPIAAGSRVLLCPGSANLWRRGGGCRS
uniref:Uncharacterized protein n=1 Tax=Arundo donax TaxID=35708 RepID=A0A0A9EI42_ARUDO